MKKIFCPKCDTPISLSRERIDEARQSGDGRLTLLCPNCTRQINLRIRLPKEKAEDKPTPEAESLGHLIVVENTFGYKQYFPLHLGTQGIGRRNKDTQVDIPILTTDPSMDRHHCLIRVTQGKTGVLRFALADDNSRVGTFLGGRLLEPKEWAYLEPGDVLTLGATSLIFSNEPLPTDLALEQE